VSAPAERLTVHEAFGLTRAAYFVMPRLVMEAMPPEWQDRFVRLIEEAHEMYVFDEKPYEVRMRDHDGRFVVDPLGDYRHGQDALVKCSTVPWS